MMAAILIKYILLIYMRYVENSLKYFVGLRIIHEFESGAMPMRTPMSICAGAHYGVHMWFAQQLFRTMDEAPEDLEILLLSSKVLCFWQLRRPIDS